jgi:hypothetical protein
MDEREDEGPERGGGTGDRLAVVVREAPAACEVPGKGQVNPRVVERETRLPVLFQLHRQIRDEETGDDQRQ